MYFIAGQLLSHLAAHMAVQLYICGYMRRNVYLYMHVVQSGLAVQ